MPLPHVLMLLVICLIWAANNVVSKLIIGDLQIPPFAFATIRFAIVTLAVSPWLRPIPRPVSRLIVVALFMGVGNFGFLFLGFRSASPSSIAIVNQLSVPVTTILSVLLLGERIHWRRGMGIVLTIAGAATVMWNPGAVTLSPGLLWSAASALCFSIGAVMIKQMSSVKPLQFQAWLGAWSVAPLLLMSILSEHGQIAAIVAGGWPLAAGTLYSAVGSSIIAYTGYFWLLQKYEVNVVAPLTLLVPIFTIVMGMSITHDRFDERMALGTVMTLLGVLIILLRPKTIGLRMALLRGRG